MKRADGSSRNRPSIKCQLVYLVYDNKGDTCDGGALHEGLDVKAHIRERVRHRAHKVLRHLDATPCSAHISHPPLQLEALVLGSLTAVEQMWHTQGSQGLILALASRLKPLRPPYWCPLRWARPRCCSNSAPIPGHDRDATACLAPRGVHSPSAGKCAQSSYTWTRELNYPSECCNTWP